MVRSICTSHLKKRHRFVLYLSLFVVHYSCYGEFPGSQEKIFLVENGKRETLIVDMGEVDYGVDKVQKVLLLMPCYNGNGINAIIHSECQSCSHSTLLKYEYLLNEKVFMCTFSLNKQRGSPEYLTFVNDKYIIVGDDGKEVGSFVLSFNPILTRMVDPNWVDFGEVVPNENMKFTLDKKNVYDLASVTVDNKHVKLLSWGESICKVNLELCLMNIYEDMIIYADVEFSTRQNELFVVPLRFSVKPVFQVQPNRIILGVVKHNTPSFVDIKISSSKKFCITKCRNEINGIECVVIESNDTVSTVRIYIKTELLNKGYFNDFIFIYTDIEDSPIALPISGVVIRETSH